MKDEEVGQADKAEEGNPPRKSVIVGVVRRLYYRYRGANPKKKKEYTFHQANERRMSDWTRGVGYFTLALVITSAIANWITWQQLREMRSASDDTKRLIKAAQDSAKAAQDAVAIAKDTAERQLRAYVAIEGVTCSLDGNKIKVHIALRNSGQTPAYDVRATTHTTPIIPDVTIVDFGTTEGKERPRLVIGYNTTVVAHNTYIIESDSEVFMNELKKTTSSIVVTGKTEYRDVFGHPHWLTFKLKSTGFEGDQWKLQPEPDGNEADEY